MASTDDAYNDTDATASEQENPRQSFEHKRTMTKSVIAAFAATSAAIAALPLPVKDAVMLSPIELAEINALASIYDIPQEESVHKILDAMAQLGIVSMAARGVIGIVGKGSGLKIATRFRNSAIAAAIVAGVGICSAYAFEQVYLGKRSIDDLGVARKVRQTDAWQTISRSASNKFEDLVNPDTFDGLKVFANEMAKTVNLTS
jgi:uncharacterized protein (DUF697 family)